MFALRDRLLCALVALAVGLLIAGQPLGWLFVAQIVLLAYGYIRYGPMVAAFRAYHACDWSRLERLLGEVRRPAWLRAPERAYFEFLRGVLATVRGDALSARRHLAVVDPARLRTDHIRCVLECYRAEAALSAGDVAAAASHLASARALPHRPEADTEITRLESLVTAR